MNPLRTKHSIGIQWETKRFTHGIGLIKWPWVKRKVGFWKTMFYCGQSDYSFQVRYLWFTYGNTTITKSWVWGLDI